MNISACSKKLKKRTIIPITETRIVIITKQRSIILKSYGLQRCPQQIIPPFPWTKISTNPKKEKKKKS